VTDSIEVERMLRERNEALEHADRLKSEFIANVSYELRTPLNTMIGFTEILANQFFGTLNERQTEYATGILESSQQLLALINDMLDLASIEAGHVVLEVEPVDLRALLDGVAKLFTERARGGEIGLSIDCPDDIGSLDMDKRRTKQILFNLMSNALKFTPREGTVVLGAKREADDGASLWVADSGIGIPESDRERIFDKFYTAEHRSRGRAGPGLGLALVKSFVELHGGRVEIDSTPGEGTTVACHFPRRPPQGETLMPSIRLVSEN
jgi:signal transduction histidine kinase